MVGSASMTLAVPPTTTICPLPCCHFLVVAAAAVAVVVANFDRHRAS